MRTIYDPAKSPAEISLWNELEIPLGAGFDDNFCGFCKRGYSSRGGGGGAGEAVGGDFVDDEDGEDGLQRLLEDLGDGDTPYVPEKRRARAVPRAAPWAGRRGGRQRT